MKPIDTFVAVDIESTGLNPEKSSIIEIGAVKIIDGSVADTYSSLVRYSFSLSDTIKELTGITDEMLAEAPSEATAMRDFLEFAGELPLLGHCIGFDYSFLKLAAERIGCSFERFGIDTLDLSKKFHSTLPGRTLSDMCSYYSIINKNAHRALDDAYAAAKLYDCLCKDFYNNEPDSFKLIQLNYSRKKAEPITDKQKKYLLDLTKYHKIDITLSIDKLTKSEASRMIDKIILEHGMLPRGSRPKASAEK